MTAETETPAQGDAAQADGVVWVPVQKRHAQAVDALLEGLSAGRLDAAAVGWGEHLHRAERAELLAWLMRVCLGWDPAQSMEQALTAFLPREERAEMLRRLIAVCAADDAIEIMDEALREMTGPPGARWTSMTDEAKNWVSIASQAEVKIYLLACFGALAKADRVKFLGAAQRMVLK